MNTVIRINSGEFNEELFKKIKSFINSIGAAEITISVDKKNILKQDKSPLKAYLNKIDKSINELKNGNVTEFTMDELDKFIHEP